MEEEQERKPFGFKPWMWVALILVIFNLNSVGNRLEKIFGQGADKWIISILFIALIIYVFAKKK